MKYIKDGVVYGTITADSYAIGYNTVLQMAMFAMENRLVSFIIPIFILLPLVILASMKIFLELITISDGE